MTVPDLMHRFMVWAKSCSPGGTAASHTDIARALGMSSQAISNGLREGRSPATVQAYLDQLAAKGWPAARVVVDARIEEVR